MKRPPNLWADAWLAALAQSLDYEVTTFDRGFKSFCGLKLRLLEVTLVRQVIEGHHLRARCASAEEPTLRGRDWIEQQWEAARIEGSRNGQGRLGSCAGRDSEDPAGSETIKRLWDEDTHARIPLKVVLFVPHSC